MYRPDSDDERQTISTPSRSSSFDKYDYPLDSDDDEIMPWGGPKVRRGSEGYEVREESREEILRRYIESRGEDVGRYQRYVPETSATSEEEDNSLPLNGSR